MDFEWDPAKADANLARHRVDFEDAINIFDDSFATVEIDPRNYSGETRYRVTGCVDSTLLFVCYTILSQRYRIISARRASLP